MPQDNADGGGSEGRVSIKIDKGIPPPLSQSKALSDAMGRLSVGDSFIAPDGMKHTSALYEAARTSGIKITARTEGASVRAWRIA